MQQTHRTLTLRPKTLPLFSLISSGYRRLVTNSKPYKESTSRESDDDAAPPGIWHMSSRPALIRLLRALTEKQWDQTDPALYDRLSRFLGNFTSKFPAERSPDLAHLQLYHPTRPSHSKAVHAYKAILESNPASARSVLSAASRANRTRMAYRLERALDLALRGGHSEDAAWLKTTIETQFPWFDKAVSATTQNDYQDSIPLVRRIRTSDYHDSIPLVRKIRSRD